MIRPKPKVKVIRISSPPPKPFSLFKTKILGVLVLLWSYLFVATLLLFAMGKSGESEEEDDDEGGQRRHPKEGGTT